MTGRLVAPGVTPGSFRRRRCPARRRRRETSGQRHLHGGTLHQALSGKKHRFIQPAPAKLCLPWAIRGQDHESRGSLQLNDKELAEIEASLNTAIHEIVFAVHHAGDDELDDACTCLVTAQGTIERCAEQLALLKDATEEAA